MENIKFSEMSNAEIKLKIKAFEDEYEVLKNKIAEIAIRMNVLDKLYEQGKKELNKRHVI